MATGKIALVDDAGYVTRISPPSNTTGADKEIMLTDDTDIVHNTGDESISGIKTFSDIAITNGFDLGQQWVDETANRAIGVTYTNDTGKPIMVFFNCGTSGEISSFEVDGVYIGRSSNFGTSQAYGAYAIVPNGSTYRALDLTGASTVGVWAELK